MNNVIHRALSCIKERRLPDTLLALHESFLAHYGLRYFRHCQSRRMRRTGGTASIEMLKTTCEKALKEGSAISMQDIVYGPAHWEQSGVLSKAPRYYNFLAGFVRAMAIRKIVEVGTWYGGSTQALHRGLCGKGTIVTVDVCLYNPDGLKLLEGVTRITGDAASHDTLQSILQHIEPPIDLLYLDGDHRYESNRDIINRCAPVLRPQWVIMDDIHWQWSMERLWAQVLKYHAAHALDAGTEYGFRVGTEGQGFGVIDFRNRPEYKV